ncbi:MAG: LPS-assembly protein LptD [Candidatus Eisenbacteria bacterium]|nr:LPS-assembly protein LptD [Candidatus Eisenbacteria bacterium]
MDAAYAMSAAFRAGRFAPVLALLLAFFPVRAASQELPEHAYLTGDRLSARSLSDGGTEVDVIGNVRYLDRDRGVHAAGDRAVWLKGDRTLRMSGRVRIYREGSWIYGPLGLIDRDREIMIFPRGVLVVEGDRTVVADRGIFHTGGAEADADSARFFGSVTVLDSSRSVIADSLTVHGGSGEAIALGGVELELYRDFYRILGGRALFSDDRIIVTESPRLIEMDSLRAEIGSLEGDTITLLTDEERIIASGSTRGAYQDVNTRSDKTVMEGEERVVLLTGSPSLVREGESMGGDSIRIRFNEEHEIDSVAVLGSGRLASRKMEPFLEETGVTEADRIDLLFAGGDLSRVTAVGGAVSDRFLLDKEEGVREKNHAAGDTIRFFLVEEDLKRIEVAGAAQGDHVSVPADAEEEEEEKERARYHADRIEFHTDRDLVVLIGHAHVDQGDMQLDAERIRYDLSRSVVNALGSPVLQDGPDRVDGKRMIYNVDRGQGTIFDGVTKYDQGICYGEEIVRVGPNTLLLRDGKYTSCDLEHPHYYFRADRMKIYLNDKSVVAPIVLYIADIPLIALPYYIFPLKGGRASGFILPVVEFGFSESKGRFIRNGGYFWAINDYADMTVRGDFYQDSHWVGYLDGRYRVRYLLSGSLNTSYKSSVGGRKRWSVQANHTQELGEDLDLTMRANFVSDKSYRVEESTTLEELDRTLKSDLVLKKRWSDKSVQVQMTRTERLDQDRIDETLPSVNFTMSRRELIPPPEEKTGGGSADRRWHNGIYWQYSSRLLNAREKNGDERDDHAGWKHDLGLNLSHKVGEWLGLSTRLNWEENWYDRDKLGQRNVRRGTMDASASVNTNVYGTWFPRIGPLIGVRHIATPSVSFSYRPRNPNHFAVDEDGSTQDRFYTFSGFGGSQRASRTLGFRLSNKLQTKYRVGEEERRNDQLLLLTNSIGYDLEKDRSEGEEPWSQLQSSLRFQPVQVFSSELSLSHNVYTWIFSGLSVRSSLRLSGTLGKTVSGGFGDADSPDAGLFEEKTESLVPFEEDRTEPYRGEGGFSSGKARDSSSIPWTASFSHSFSRGSQSGDFSQWLNSRFGVGLTANWEIDYENRYDLEARETVSQGFRIGRNLHCWEASLRGRYSGREWEYYFNIRIKAHTEIYYEKGERRLGF